jgi:acetoin utilization protein AcuC
VLKSSLIKEITAKTQDAATTTVLVHSDQYAHWIFDPSHPTQGRRFMHAKKLLTESLSEKDTELTILEPRLATMNELLRVHSSRYIAEVLDDHKSGQWSGARPDLSNLAALFAGGTLVALDALLRGKTNTAIHFPGAKHHAQYDYSSGFCVFGDFALAADIATKDHGKRVAILDIDAHHGDGTENLTAENPNVLSFSIHEKGIFPGTGNSSIPEKFAHNFPLGDESGEGDIGKGNEALLKGVAEFGRLADEFNADLIFVAAGADGHAEDPLSSLRFTFAGYEAAAKYLRKQFSDTPILVGGAGGYLPDSRTPEVWSKFATELAKTFLSISNSLTAESI